MKAAASSKTSPSHTQSNVSKTDKRKKLGWPWLRWFRRKETFDRILDEKDEKALLAERIMMWQQESSREEICTPILHAVESTAEKVKTLTLKEPEVRTGHKSENTNEQSEENLEFQNVAPTSRDANVSLHEMMWHVDVLPLAIKQGLHSLWAEGAKHLPTWLNIDRRPATTDPSLFHRSNVAPCALNL